MLKKTVFKAINFLWIFLKIQICRNLKTNPSSILFPVIWITNRCNLRCQMCDQWKTTPSLFAQELSTKQLYSFVDSASRMKAAVIVITGGEPFLRSDIFNIISYIRNKGIACHICSNGTLLDEVAVRKIKNAGLNSIAVSLDSNCEKIHNTIRGVNCFSTVTEGIKRLRDIAPGIKIGINCVITKQNFHDIHRMILFAEKLGVDQIKFDPIHTHLMHRTKSCLSFGGLLFEKSDFPELLQEIDKLIRVASQTKLLTNSTIFLKGIEQLYGGSFPRFRCYSGYISCAIDAFGRVSPCDNFEGVESIRDKPLEQIWNSPAFQNLRCKVQECKTNCWDTTHGELNIRCSLRGLMHELDHVCKEIKFYLSCDDKT